MALMGETIFGVAAADDQRHDPVAEFPALDVGPECRDLAGDFKSGNIRARRAAADNSLAAASRPVG